MIPYLPHNEWRPRHRATWNWLKLPPAVVYYNALDCDGDEQNIAYCRGWIAERLDKAADRATKGLQIMGGFAVAASLDLPPLPVLVSFVAGVSYLTAAVKSYIGAARQTEQMIEKGQGCSFEDFDALQRMYTDLPSNRPSVE